MYRWIYYSLGMTFLWFRGDLCTCYTRSEGMQRRLLEFGDDIYAFRDYLCTTYLWLLHNFVITYVRFIRGLYNLYVVYIRFIRGLYTICSCLLLLLYLWSYRGDVKDLTCYTVPSIYITWRIGVAWLNLKHIFCHL